MAQNEVSLIDLDFSGFPEPDPGAWTSTPASNKTNAARNSESVTESKGKSSPLNGANQEKDNENLSPDFLRFKSEAIAIGLTDPDSQAAYIVKRFEQCREIVQKPSVMEQGPKIQLKHFDPMQEDWEMFIHRFERLAKELGWSMNQQLIHLVSSLEGRAAEVYRRTDHNRDITYGRLRDELERAFAKTAEQLAEKFQKSFIGKNESAHQFASSLEEKFRNWFARANDNEEPTVQGLINFSVREQFLLGLPQECRREIKKFKLKSMDDIAEYTENYLRSLPDTTSSYNHKKTVVELKQNPKNYGTKPWRPVAKSNQSRCWQCQTKEHHWRDCPKKGPTKTAAAGTSTTKKSTMEPKGNTPSKREDRKF